MAYLKTFAADKFKEAPKKLELPKDVASSEESIKRGKEMFEAIECHKCHGTEGRGRRALARRAEGRVGAPDPARQPGQALDVPRRRLAARTIATRHRQRRARHADAGLPRRVEKPEDIWHLTNFIVSLGPESPRYATLVTVDLGVGRDPRRSRTRSSGRSSTPSNIPLMGQVIVDPRNFNPSIDLVVGAGRLQRQGGRLPPDVGRSRPSRRATASRPSPTPISLQFPPQITAGTERPYFLMGDGSDAVYLLRWEQGKGVVEASANGPAKIAPLHGRRGGRQGGVRQRPVPPRDQAAARRRRARRGRRSSRRCSRPSPFQAWDGGAGETGPKMSLTSWYYLRLEEPQSNRRFIIPPVVAILTLAAMILVVRTANRAR